MASERCRVATFVGATALAAILTVFLTAVLSIVVTVSLKAVLAFILKIIATVGEVCIAVIAAVASGFTISLTVVLAASTSAITFSPSQIEARLVISIAVAMGSIATSAIALLLMTTLRVDVELAVAVVTTAAFAVAFASAWAVGVMSLVERETQQVGLKMTSLLQAVRHNKYHVLSLLVRLPFGSHQRETNTALLYAVKAGFVECVRVLISAGANPNILDAYDNTPLIAACQSGSLASVRILLEAGAVLDYRNGSKETALHHAAKWGHETCVELLLSKGADPGVLDNLWRTPLMLTVRYARKPYAIIRMLFDADCDVNAIGSDSRTALHYAALRGLDLVALLTAGAQLGSQDSEGNTPLHLAALEGHIDSIKCLLEAGAEQNVANYVRRRPVHLAAAKGDVDCIKVLLSSNADPMAMDGAGHYPVNHAVMSGKREAMVYFLRRNCFPGARAVATPIDNIGLPPVSPLRVALEKNLFYFARILVGIGCDASPLRERQTLLRGRTTWRDESQIVHYIWLQTCLQNTWSLIDLARVAIRRRMRNPVSDVPLLPLPNQMRDFLMLRDLDEISGEDHVGSGAATHT